MVVRPGQGLEATVDLASVLEYRELTASLGLI